MQTHKKQIDDNVKLNLEGISPYILEQIEQGLYELPEKTLASKYLNKKDNVLELGSAIGYLGIHTIKKHPGIYWMSIEANPWCVSRSEENCLLNHVYPFVLHGLAGLEKSNELVKFYVREEFWNSSMDPIELEYSKITEENPH